jgi:hypothetical protein
MLRTRLHLTRSAALAGLLLATAAASATAAGPTLSLHRGTLTYAADPAAAVADEIRFESGFIGGDMVVDLHHDLPVTIAANASAACDPEGAVIRCATYAITALAAVGGPGDDRLAVDPDIGVGPRLPLLADGGPGDDELSGGSDRDLLDGRDGDDVLRGEDLADTLIGGDGLDALVGGGGDDLLRAEDALAESAIDCGTGLDRLVHDAGDATTGCETLELSGPAPVDPPADPPSLPIEPSVEPPIAPGGQPSAPVGPPAEPAPRTAAPPRLAVAIDARFAPARRTTTVTRLRLRGIPAGTSLTLSCRPPARAAAPRAARACRAVHHARRFPRGARQADLLPALRGRALPAGAVLRLRLVRSGTSGLVRSYRLRPAEAPLATTRP